MVARLLEAVDRTIVAAEEAKRMRRQLDRLASVRAEREAAK